MKKILLITLLFCNLGFTQNQTINDLFYPCQNSMTVYLDEDGVCNSNNYYLIFEEEFNGNMLDLNKWHIQPHKQGSLTSDVQQEYNSLDNIQVGNGICSILCKYQPGNYKVFDYYNNTTILSDGQQNLRHHDYTSANIWSKKKFEPGIFEIKCKLPGDQGMWPAFWLFDDNPVDIYNEIDIFEFWMHGNVISKKKFYTNMYHYDHTNQSNDILSCSKSSIEQDFTSQFHIFTLVFDNYQLKWYIDGELKRVNTRFVNMLGQIVGCNSLSAYNAYVMDKTFPDAIPLNLIFNLAVQKGSYSPNSTTFITQYFEIDYIRYWKKMECTDDLTITNDMINPELYNFYIADNIYVSNNVSVTSNNQLNLTAGESITIEPGFNTQNNAFFSAEIKPNQCSTGFSGFINNSGGSATVNENKKMISEKEIFIYPNPVTDLLTIENNEIQDIKLYDLNGDDMKINYSMQLNKTILSMANIAPGLYFLVLYGNNGSSSTFKIIKE